MTIDEQSGRTLTIQRDDLSCRLEFARRGDRWSHRFSVIRAGVLTGTIESLEGDADEVWPVSPPLQELSIEDRDDQQVALLVGMSGNSHWSCSVSPVDAENRIGWEFDVACRAKQSPGSLGSRYHSAENGDDQKLQIKFEACNGCIVEPIGNCDFNLACEWEDGNLPRTVCWKYQIVTMLR